MKVIEELRRRPWTLLELALAGLLIAWRCVAPTWHSVGLDILFYLGIYWAYLALFPDSKTWNGVTLALMLFAMGIYLKQQLPHALLMANLLP